MLKSAHPWWSPVFHCSAYGVKIGYPKNWMVHTVRDQNQDPENHIFCLLFSNIYPKFHQLGTPTNWMVNTETWADNTQIRQMDGSYWKYIQSHQIYPQNWLFWPIFEGAVPGYKWLYMVVHGHSHESHHVKGSSRGPQDTAQGALVRPALNQFAFRGWDLGRQEIFRPPNEDGTSSS